MKKLDFFDVLSMLDSKDFIFGNCENSLSSNSNYWKKTEKGFQGIFDLSGFNQDEIKLTFDGNKNKINLKTEKSKENEALSFLNKSNIEHSFTFEDKIDNVSSNLKNGILYVYVEFDKKEEKTIDIINLG